MVRLHTSGTLKAVSMVTISRLEDSRWASDSSGVATLTATSSEGSCLKGEELMGWFPTMLGRKEVQAEPLRVIIIPSLWIIHNRWGGKHLWETVIRNG